MLSVPYVTAMVLAALANYDRSLERASLSLGVGPVRTFFRITLPLIRTGVIAGAISAFLISLDNFSLSLFITKGDTLPLRLMQQLLFYADPSVAAMSTLLLVGSAGAGRLRASARDLGAGPRSRRAGGGPRGANDSPIRERIPERRQRQGVAYGEELALRSASSGWASAAPTSALSWLTAATVVGVCQRDEASVRKVAAQYGIAGAFTRWQDLIERARPDIVVIATPPRLHREIALAAFASGAHVLCEKPLAMNRAEARDMVEAAAKHGRVGMTCFNWRYTVAMQEMQRRMAEGFVGRVFHVSGRWLAGVVRGRENPCHLANGQGRGGSRRDGRHGRTPRGSRALERRRDRERVRAHGRRLSGPIGGRSLLDHCRAHFGRARDLRCEPGRARTGRTRAPGVRIAWRPCLQLAPRHARVVRRRAARDGGKRRRSRPWQPPRRPTRAGRTIPMEVMGSTIDGAARRATSSKRSAPAPRRRPRSQTDCAHRRCWMPWPSRRRAESG